MRTQARAETILQIVQRALDIPIMVNRDPFETLVLTIISQNTSDINTKRAFETLSDNFEITPETLANAPINQVEKCLFVTGLYRNKTRTIQTASKIIIERFNGCLKSILSLPLEKARKTLTEIPGVGFKTADVVLLFSTNQPTVPVDSHVNRVSKRLGLAPADGDYEVVRLSLQRLFEPKYYLELHLSLIALGKKYCKARKPLCSECPVNIYCPLSCIGEGQ
jgi:endonuclease-3